MSYLCHITAPTSKKTAFFSRNVDKSPAIDHGVCSAVLNYLAVAFSVACVANMLLLLMISVVCHPTELLDIFKNVDPEVVGTLRVLLE